MTPKIQEEDVEAAGRAIYEMHRFVRPWDDPNTVRIWHDVCLSEARAAIATLIARGWVPPGGG